MSEHDAKNILTRIKSNIILKIIFHKLKYYKLLNIIKYNKNIQNKLNLDIRDYKECCDKNSETEIEIIPVKGQCGIFFNNLHGNFLYLYDWVFESGQFQFIFFKKNEKGKDEQIKDDKKIKELTSSLKISKEDKISKILLVIKYKIETYQNLFHSCNIIKSIKVKNKSKKNNIRNISYMFAGCSSLESVDLSLFNTENVITMSHMFYGCTSLKKIIFEDNYLFNTKNVGDMESMFNDCKSLKSINLKQFETGLVKNMSYMFNNCSSLELIDLSSFNTENLKNIMFIFNNCISLEKIDISSFDLNLMKHDCMINYCISLKSIKFKNDNGKDKKKCFFKSIKTK